MSNKLFPVCVIDDFYTDPYAVRECALSQKFNPNTDNRWPGARTDPIDTFNEDLFYHFCGKILSLFYSMDEIKNYKVDTYFQLIKPFHPEKTNKNNRGFIHQDETLFGGVVYLDPDPEERTGTSIYTPKTKWWHPSKLDGQANNIKFKKYAGNPLNDEDMETWDKSRDQYVESIRVENIFNRCILFDGNNHHGVPYFGTKERLTQVFFIPALHLTHKNPKYPLIRNGIG
jgi:hypothetical protein